MDSLSVSKRKDSAARALQKIPPNRYQEQYGVIVICIDESHQKKVYDKLFKDGLKCKVVVT